MFTVERRVGRLIEMRVQSMTRREGLEVMFRLIDDALAGIPPEEEGIVVTDYRTLDVLLPDVASGVSESMARARPRVARTAVLLAPGHAIARMQLTRLMHAATTPTRRVTDSPVEVESWLGEVLRPDEQQRLRVFLHEEPTAPVP